MTGREIIIYILKNKLEDQNIAVNVFNINGQSVLITVEKAAADFGVGPATVNAWCLRKFLDFITLDGQVYILKNKRYEEVKSWEEI